MHQRWVEVDLAVKRCDGAMTGVRSLSAKRWVGWLVACDLRGSRKVGQLFVVVECGIMWDSERYRVRFAGQSTILASITLATSALYDCGHHAGFARTVS